MIPSWARQTITIIKPGIKEVRGSEVFDWEHPVSSIEVKGCSVQPTTTSLSQDGRILGVMEGYTAYIPENTEVDAGYHIQYEGKIYEIDGEPKRWIGPLRTSHIQLNLRRWEG